MYREGSVSVKNKELVEIVLEVRENKVKNFERLYKEIWKTVYYMALKIMKNSEEAEDVSQEIIIYIYDHIEDVRSAEAFNQWMNRVIMGTCYRFLNKNMKEKDHMSLEEKEYDVEDDDKANLPETFLELKETRQFIINIIDNLPQKQREVILLYYYEQLTAPEIAKVLDCSLTAVRDRLFNGKKNIRNRIEKQQKKKGETIYSLGGLTFLTSLLQRDVSEMNAEVQKASIWQGVYEHIQRTSGMNTDNLNPMKKSKQSIFIISIATFILIGSMSGFSIYKYVQRKNQTEMMSNLYRVDNRIPNHLQLESENNKNTQPETKGVVETQGDTKEEKESEPLETLKPEDTQEPAMEKKKESATESTQPFNQEDMVALEENNIQEEELEEPYEFVIEPLDETTKEEEENRLPQIYIDHQILYYECNTQLTIEQVFSDGNVRAFDELGNQLEVTVSGWDQLEVEVPGAYGIYLEAIDHQGNHAVIRTLLIRIKE